MIRLFDRYADGASELLEVIGVISAGVTYDKWEPLLPLGVRDVEAIIGPEPVRALADFYESDECCCGTEEMQEALLRLRQAVAYFTWLKIIPTLDAQHDENGRSRRLGENEKGLTALQEFKDEENIRRLAYEAVDALIAIMEDAGFDFWLTSRCCRRRQSLIIRSKEEFDEYYHIGSHRLFVTLLPIISEVQTAELLPVTGPAVLQQLLSRRPTATTAMIGEAAARAVVLLTMKKAVERLPVEVIPEGVVQIQQSQPVNSRLKAEQAARGAVAASLGNDARRLLDLIEATLQSLDDDDAAATDDIVLSPIAHSKGFTF